MENRDRHRRSEHLRHWAKISVVSQSVREAAVLPTPGAPPALPVLPVLPAPAVLRALGALVVLTALPALGVLAGVLRATYMAPPADAPSRRSKPTLPGGAPSNARRLTD